MVPAAGTSVRTGPADSSKGIALRSIGKCGSNLRGCPFRGLAASNPPIEVKGTRRHMDGARLALKSEEKGKLYQREGSVAGWEWRTDREGGRVWAVAWFVTHA